MRRSWLTALLTLAAACGNDRQGATTRVDSAGVQIVTYSGPDVPLAWGFDSLFTLGGADSGAQAFYQLRGGVVGADAAGNIYILDTQAKHIVVFDSTGALVRTMGRPGGGPGEMQWPITLVVAPDGRAAAFDMGAGRLVWFDTAGAIGDLVSLRGIYNGGTMRATAGALLLRSRQWSTGPNDPGREDLLRIAGADTVRLASIPNIGGKAVELKSCGMSFAGVSPIFTPTMRWGVVGDRVAVTSVAGYEVMLLTGTDTTHILRRSIAPQPATAEAAAKQVGTKFRVMSSAGEIVCKTDEVVSQLGYADRIPIVSEITDGPDSTWWVRRAEATGVDVYAVDGEYLGTLPASAPYPLVALPGDRIAAIVTDDLDVDRLVVYRVRRSS